LDSTKPPLTTSSFSLSIYLLFFLSFSLQDYAIEASLLIKRVCAIVLGLICGGLPVLGLGGLVAGISCSFAVHNIFLRSYLRMPEARMKILNERKMEGVLDSVALFLLSWILAYNVL